MNDKKCVTVEKLRAALSGIEGNIDVVIDVDVNGWFNLEGVELIRDEQTDGEYLLNLISSNEK